MTLIRWGRLYTCILLLYTSSRSFRVGKFNCTHSFCFAHINHRGIDCTHCISLLFSVLYLWQHIQTSITRSLPEIIRSVLYLYILLQRFVDFPLFETAKTYVSFYVPLRSHLDWIAQKTKVRSLSYTFCCSSTYSVSGEKREWQYFGHNFDKFRCIFVIYCK